jgi:hypothetical protein
MEVVSALIDMSVGVSGGGITVGVTEVRVVVGARESSVG